MSFHNLRKRIISNFLKMPVRDFFIYLTLFITTIFFITFLFQLSDNVKKNLQSELASVGFKNVTVKTIEKNMDGFTAIDVSLDAYNFDTIKTIKINVNWFLYLTTGHVNSMQIDGLYLTRNIAKTPINVQFFLQQLQKPQAQRVKLTNISYNLITNYGDLRINGDLTLTPEKEGYDLKATLKSSQHQMSFNTSWHGKISNNKEIDIFGEVLDGRINMGDLRMSRLNGWLSLYNNQNGTKGQLSINAGSAFYKKTPLQNLSVTSEITNESYLLSARLGISGEPSTLSTFDFEKKNGKLNSNINFESNNFRKLLGLLDLSKNNSNAIKTLKINANLQQDLQFKDGPMPYSLSMTVNNAAPTNGNILFYTDTWDARGNLKLDKKYQKELESVFKIKNNNVSENYLRLDGNIKKLLNIEKK